MLSVAEGSDGFFVLNNAFLVLMSLLIVIFQVFFARGSLNVWSLEVIFNRVHTDTTLASFLLTYDSFFLLISTYLFLLVYRSVLINAC